MNILIVYGTRPEWLKIKPIVEELKKNDIAHKILQIRQHTDLIDGMTCNWAHVIVNEPSSPGLTGGRLDRLSLVMSSVVKKVGYVLGVREEFTHVLVQGDTHTAVSAALAAFNNKVPVIHIESGLRTYNPEQPWPEEINRQIISRLASYHFCPTEEDKKNLIDERVFGKIYVVGNTVLDNIREMEAKQEEDYVLITMHRRENHEKLENWFKQFELLAKKDPDTKFYFVAHPNPAVQKHLHLFEAVEVLEPMGHDEFVKRLAGCRYVITDSGGVQEESAFFDKLAFVCRRQTERMAGVRTAHHVMVQHYGYVWQITCVERTYEGPDAPCPYGDGYAAEKIVKILQEEARR